MPIIQPGFGQPAGAIMQIAYVVPDIQATMARWTREVRIGPFFLFEKFTLNNLQYRGKPSTLNISLACAYSGSMCFELIQQHDNTPSVYLDTVASSGYGFHHWAIMTDAFDAERQRFETSGVALAMHGTVPDDTARVAYLDTRTRFGGMTELIELTPGTNALFTMMKTAAIEWDGSQPLRIM